MMRMIILTTTTKLILSLLLLLLLSPTSLLLFVVGDGPNLSVNCVVSTTDIEGYDVDFSSSITLNSYDDRCYVRRSWNTIESDFTNRWSNANCRGGISGPISFNFVDNPNDSITIPVMGGGEDGDTPTTIICQADGYDAGNDDNACVGYTFEYAIYYYVKDVWNPDVSYHDPDSCCGNDCSCSCPNGVIEVETDETNCFYSAGRNENFGTLVATDNCGVQGGLLPGFIHYDSNYRRAVATDITLSTFLYAEQTHVQSYVFYDDYEYWNDNDIENALDDGLDGTLGDSLDGTLGETNYPGCLVTFRAVDKTPPQITCPETQYLVVDPDPEANSCVTTNDITIPGPVAVWDNCGDTTWPVIGGYGFEVKEETEATTTTTFPKGKTTLTYTATDEANNVASCEFDVIVEDKTPPKAICPASAAGDNVLCADDRTIGVGIALANDEGECGRTVDYFDDLDGDGPHFEENCDDDDDVCETFSIVSGTFFPVSGLKGGPQGPIPITYTVTDSSGNTDSCTFEVEVYDNEDPVIESCPKDIELENEPGICSAPIDYCTPVAYDNCPGELTVTSTAETTVDTIGVCPDLVDEVIENGTRLPVGSTTVVTHTVTDQFGNSASCEQVVSVVDTEDPTFSAGNDGGCPGDIRLPATHNCGRYVFYAEPYATDNCQDGELLPKIDNDNYRPGNMFYHGETEVIWTATDASGNTAECSFIIEIYDGEELDPSNINCGTKDGIIPMGSTGSFETNYNGDTLKENGCPTESAITCATCQVCSYEGVAYDVSGSDCEVDVGSNVVQISQAGDIGSFISYPVQVTDLEGRTVTATCTVCVDSPSGVNRRKLWAEEESKKGERPNRGRSRPRGGGGGRGRSVLQQNETAEEEEEEIIRKLGKGSSLYDSCDIPILDSTEYLGSLSQCEYDGGKGKGSSEGKGKGGKGNFDWSCPKDWDPLNNDFKCQSAC